MTSLTMSPHAPPPSPVDPLAPRPGGAGRPRSAPLATLGALLALALLPAAASAQRSLAIRSFHADVDVRPDGTVRVVEDIEVEFQGSWNGIYRTIPVQYRTPQGFDYHLVLDVGAVEDGTGAPLRHEVSRERHYKKVKVWVPGAQDAVRRVRLSYTSPNALRFFEEHDELYWNVTGDEWEVPIREASARVRLPAGATGLRATAFTGGYGSREQAATIEESEDGFVIRTDRPLGFKEGLTVAVGWDPGFVERPTAPDRIVRFLRSNMLLLFPFFSLAGMWQIWRSKGRDPDRRPVTVQWRPPEGLTPAEVGTLVDGSPDMRDLTATLVDLAVRGYLKIEERDRGGLAGLFGGTEWVLHRTRPATEWRELHAHERGFLNGVFSRGAVSERELSDLEEVFYKNLPGIRSGIFDRLLGLGFWTSRPDSVRNAWLGVGLAVTVLATFGFAALAGWLSLSRQTAVVAGILTGLPVVVFAFVMPARTTKGVRALEEVLGFQEFLERVESDRFRRMIESPADFERYLPHALALGVERRWAKAFEDIYTEPPDWYVGGAGPGRFHTGRLVGNLHHFSSAAGSALASAPRSSGGSGFGGGGGGGGGSSGGGFGGGGGGGF